jgi:hypothetical protein
MVSVLLICVIYIHTRNERKNTVTVVPRLFKDANTVFQGYTSNGICVTLTLSYQGHHIDIAVGRELKM